MANVQVGCKLPNGLILAHAGQKVTLAGANASALVNGFGITQVDKELWDGWLEIHKNMKAVQNGLIFAVDSATKTEGATKERQSQKSGMEGLDPDKPTAGVKKDKE